MKRVCYFALHSYVFWALMSLYNHNLMVYAVAPWLLLLTVPIAIAKFHFLLAPLQYALTSGLLALGCGAVVARRWWTRPAAWALLAYVFNAVGLCAFISAAESDKNMAIASQLAGHHPDCVFIAPFTQSLKNAGDDFQFQAHALYTEGGKTYYWSYSAMDFYEGNARLDPNFRCRN